MAKTVVVAAAVIEREGRFLLTQRLSGAHLAGYWEFPGGKVEEDEDPEVTVARECNEECGLALVVGDIVEVAFHRYESKNVLLLFYACRLADGCGEVQHVGVAEHAWVLPSELGGYALPAADARLVDKLARR